MINATDKTSIGTIVQTLSHYYIDKEDSELAGKMIKYADKIHRQTKYDIGSNFHTILMAAKFLKEFSIRIVSPTDETVAVIDVTAPRQDLKNQYKAMKT
jgi:hypothetical protein